MPHQMFDQEKEKTDCNCAKTSCKNDCTRTHTCKVFWCEKCKPETMRVEERRPDDEIFNPYSDRGMLDEEINEESEPERQWEEELLKMFKQFFSAKNEEVADNVIHFVNSLLFHSREREATAYKRGRETILREITDGIESLNVTWRDRTENWDDSQDDSFEDGAEVMKKRIRSFLKADPKSSEHPQ